MHQSIPPAPSPPTPPPPGYCGAFARLVSPGCGAFANFALPGVLALLQRKTLIETKSRTLKCLKWHYSAVRSMKNVAALTEDGAFALFFRPHAGGFDSSRVPTPRKFAIQGKKNANAWGSAWGGAGRRWN